MKSYDATWAIGFLLLVLVVFVLSLSSTPGKGEPLTYTQIRNLLREGKSDQISKVIVTNGESVIQVRMAGTERVRSVVVPTELKESLVKQLDEANVELEVREPDKSGYWFSIISNFLLPCLLLIGFLFMFRSAQRR